MTLTTYRDMNHTIMKLITNDYDLSFNDNSKSQIERQQMIENINVIYRVRLMQKTSKYMKRHYLELLRKESCLLQVKTG